MLAQSNANLRRICSDFSSQPLSGPAYFQRLPYSPPRQFSCNFSAPNACLVALLVQWLRVSVEFLVCALQENCLIVSVYPPFRSDFTVEALPTPHLNSPSAAFSPTGSCVAALLSRGSQEGGLVSVGIAAVCPREGRDRAPGEKKTMTETDAWDLALSQRYESIFS
jgi:hypothetical protein